MSSTSSFLSLQSEILSVSRHPFSQCLTAYRGWRYADATGRHYVAYDKVTKQKHRIVEVKCIEQKGAPTS